jgi:hypothetical protein
MSPCDFHVFGPLKKALKGRQFTDNDEVRETVKEWFRTQPKTFFPDGIHRFVDQCDTCFTQQGDYVWTVDSYTDIVYVPLFNL